MSVSNPDLKYKLKAALGRRNKVPVLLKGWKPSAVLVPIYYQGGGNHIIFTRRTQLVKYHKGEISFPGGGFFPEDGTLLTTALRESFEEIGLRPEDVEVLGELDDVPTRGSNYIITPFVGSILSEYRFKLSDFETAEILEVPLQALLAEGCCQTVPSLDPLSPSAAPFVYAYQDHRITGATARIVKQLLDIIIGLPHQ
jgi:8-oxo-dGTP pyrophosphatase MutT (NUDIX family)